MIQKSSAFYEIILFVLIFLGILLLQLISTAMVPDETVGIDKEGAAGHFRVLRGSESAGHEIRRSDRY